LADYRGAGRRFEVMGEAGGVTWVDDYAHHPTEIRATLAMLGIVDAKGIVNVELDARARQIGRDRPAWHQSPHALEHDQDDVREGRNPHRGRRGGRLDRNVEHVVRGLFHETYNRRNLSAIDRVYAPNVRWHGAPNREGYGRAEVRAMARGLLATFPDLGLHIDEVYWMGNEEDGHSASVRWTALGTHRGYGLYGTPTGRRVHLWGISQLYFVGDRIVEDWMLFNEFDVLAQLLREEPLPVTPDRA